MRAAENRRIAPHKQTFAFGISRHNRVASRSRREAGGAERIRLLQSAVSMLEKEVGVPQQHRFQTPMQPPFPSDFSHMSEVGKRLLFTSSAASTTSTASERHRIGDAVKSSLDEGGDFLPLDSGFHSKRVRAPFSEENKKMNDGNNNNNNDDDDDGNAADSLNIKGSADNSEGSLSFTDLAARYRAPISGDRSIEVDLDGDIIGPMSPKSPKEQLILERSQRIIDAEFYDFFPDGRPAAVASVSVAATGKEVRQGLDDEDVRNVDYYLAQRSSQRKDEKQNTEMKNHLQLRRNLEVLSSEMAEQCQVQLAQENQVRSRLRLVEEEIAAATAELQLIDATARGWDERADKIRIRIKKANQSFEEQREAQVKREGKRTEGRGIRFPVFFFLEGVNSSLIFLLDSREKKREGERLFFFSLFFFRFLVSIFF